MDAKNKANFINSLSTNNTCVSCGAKVDDGDAFCQFCGKPLISSNASPQIAQEAAPTSTKISYKEPSSAFAAGLPKWSIEPPHVVVRRRKRI